MKCEKCNNNEANFYYKSTINGKTTERHLCTECAREEGFGEALDWSGRDMFDEMVSDTFGLMDSFFSGRSLFPGFGRSLLAPVLSFPRLHLFIDEPEKTAEAEDRKTVSADDAGEELRHEREIKELRNQLDEAVKAEDFEKAIKLRDKIKELEK